MKGKARVNERIVRKGKLKRRLSEEKLWHVPLKAGAWDSEEATGTGKADT